ncbi:hypothetical protein GMES_3633 [Paraglaciecola mesophila KMM 241]|uniref:Uncharacterized protein n=1 Tax=Paraglaciecola mesophila KMM 241 TaxID=1128912 RepID=K6ZRJ0_9ALTE|nr:hypothetical protein GMES_3633 [Paraglaciecola mesophila KMM 241]
MISNREYKKTAVSHADSGFILTLLNAYAFNNISLVMRVS